MRVLLLIIILSHLSTAFAADPSEPELILIGNVVTDGINSTGSCQTVEVLELLVDRDSWAPPKTIQACTCAICDKIPMGKAKLWLYVHFESGGKSWQLSKYEMLQ